MVNVIIQCLVVQTGEPQKLDYMSMSIYATSGKLVLGLPHMFSIGNFVDFWYQEEGERGVKRTVISNVQH